MFNQPGSFGNFFDLIRSRKVCLENAYMADRSTVRGTIRVQNLCMNKKVSVRYTTNEWIRSADLEAEYVPSSGGGNDGFSDQFSFKLSTAPLAVGQKIQFCLRYEPLDHGSTEFWDSALVICMRSALRIKAKLASSRKSARNQSSYAHGRDNNMIPVP